MIATILKLGAVQMFVSMIISFTRLYPHIKISEFLKHVHPLWFSRLRDISTDSTLPLLTQLIVSNEQLIITIVVFTLFY